MRVTGIQPSIFQPRFSPDGQRVALTSNSAVQTMSTSPHGWFRRNGLSRLHGNMCGDAGSGLQRNELPWRPTAVWIDTTHIAWVIQTNGSSTPANFSIISSSDTNNATLSTFMTCSGAGIPRGFAFLPDGSVVANYTAANGKVEDLVVFTKDGTGNCVLNRNLTNLSTSGSYARDFSVSPDGSMVAFVQSVAPPGGVDASGFIAGGSLYLVPTDGSAAPRPVGGGRDLYAYFGARWIAGGTHLAWNGTAPIINDDASTGELDASFLYREGGAPAMNVIAVNGTTPLHVAQSDPGNDIFIFGGGNGGGCSYLFSCSTSALNDSSTEECLALSGLVGVALLGRRRSRRRSKRIGTRTSFEQRSIMMVALESPHGACASGRDVRRPPHATRRA